MNERQSNRKQLIMALLDNGTMSTKEIAKYLNARQGTIHSLVYYLKKEGVIEHAGYSRYALTDKGRQEAGDILSGAKKDKKAVVVPKQEEKAPEMIVDETTGTKIEPTIDKEFAKEMLSKFYGDMLEILKS